MSSANVPIAMGTKQPQRLIFVQYLSVKGIEPNANGTVNQQLDDKFFCPYGFPSFELSHTTTFSQEETHFISTVSSRITICNLIVLRHQNQKK